MNRGVEKGYGRDTRNVFYDVTNYYFECDPDDLRRNGASKERRPNPIVQMGLLQDADGVPITYRLFPGSTADCATMLPVLADMKRDLGLPMVTAVADKGLNCSANMAALVASGDGSSSPSPSGAPSPAGGCGGGCSTRGATGGTPRAPSG